MKQILFSFFESLRVGSICFCILVFVNMWVAWRQGAQCGCVSIVCAFLFVFVFVFGVVFLYLYLYICISISYLYSYFRINIGDAVREMKTLWVFWRRGAPRGSKGRSIFLLFPPCIQMSNYQDPPPTLTRTQEYIRIQSLITTFFSLFVSLFVFYLILCALTPI